MKNSVWLLAGLLFFSCRKNGGDTTPPVISITAPVNNQVYTNGQTLNIRGTLTDADLHEVKIVIRDNAGVELKAFYPLVHGLSTFNFNENWTVSVTTATDATVKVEAADYTGNRGEQTVPVRLNL